MCERGSGKNVEHVSKRRRTTAIGQEQESTPSHMCRVSPKVKELNRPRLKGIFSSPYLSVCVCARVVSLLRVV